MIYLGYLFILFGLLNNAFSYSDGYYNYRLLSGVNDPYRSVPQSSAFRMQPVPVDNLRSFSGMVNQNSQSFDQSNSNRFPINNRLITTTETNFIAEDYETYDDSSKTHGVTFTNQVPMLAPPPMLPKSNAVHISNQIPMLAPPPMLPQSNMVHISHQIPMLAPSNVNKGKLMIDLHEVHDCLTNPCLNEGICTKSESGGGVGGVECKCPWGWTGLRCEICLTECASSPCPSNKKCKAKYGGGFECVCPADKVGLDCEIQNDLCSTNPCLNEGICKPIEGGSFSCVCNKPWSGDNCEKIWENPCSEETLRSNEILQFKDPWDRNSYVICTDINIYHSMPCSIGTYFNNKLHHCVPEGYDPPSCPDKHCKNDADCFVDEGNNPRCVCKKGFTGEFCENNIDECLTGGNIACAGGKCFDQLNGYYCECLNGAIGLDCNNTITNPCTSENMLKSIQFFDLKSKEGNTFIHCIGELTFVVSKCPEDLFWHSEEKTCTIERPVEKTGVCLNFPCHNGGECQDHGGSDFTCLCKNGFTGSSCDQMIDFCESNPCNNGGRCLGFTGGYTCICPDKIIDECCCHGILNPCPSKAKLIPGVNNYFPHLFPNRYLHCDFDGRAFARTCASGLHWRQEALGCLPDSFTIEKQVVKLNNSVDMVTKKEGAASAVVVSGGTARIVVDEAAEQEKRLEQIRLQQQIVQQQQLLQQQQLEQQKERDRIQLEKDAKQRELDQQQKERDQKLQQQQIEDQKIILRIQEQQVKEQQAGATPVIPQLVEDDENMRLLQKQRDDAAISQNERQQQQQIQIQQEQQRVQQQQIMQQQQQIQQQLMFQKQQQAQDSAIQQQQQKMQTQFQQQLKIVPQFLNQAKRGQVDEDENMRLLQKQRDDLAIQENARQQQLQIQIQQEQQRIQQQQIMQQQQQIQQQLLFQKQQEEQNKQEQIKQQKLQTQFQQQLKTVPQPQSAQTVDQNKRVEELSPVVTVEDDENMRLLQKQRDDAAISQNERQQQQQIQIQQEQQRVQQQQIMQQQQQIQQQLMFQKQQQAQDSAIQQQQQKMQTQFQQQLKTVPQSSQVKRVNEEDENMRLLQKQRDDLAIQENARQQQLQIQIQQEQQRIQQQQIMQQQQQIQQQLLFQKQQEEQNKQEQIKQQKLQTQFQQQLKTLPQRSTINQDINLFKSTQMSQLPSSSSPQVTFSKTANLFLKPRLQSPLKQQFAN